ncbi:hypothetical protein SAMN06265379_101376 [Saccharicrinis carchari]|uniref:Uncharacterized protein n=1 Tax=Saccharicrinis carchari TaxID=1168039 RepID=A0A521ATC7_SACCC|nr:hypothetical protein [Saccharicrinis carchari]SMO37880.1 hypothetical protein SAMN06265379_101376 [Saccharicrinis carchari]
MKGKIMENFSLVSETLGNERHLRSVAISDQITLEETVSLLPKAYTFKYNVSHLIKTSVDIEFGNKEIILKISDKSKDLPPWYTPIDETVSKTILTKKIKILNDMDINKIETIVDSSELTVYIPRTENLSLGEVRPYNPETCFKESYFG